MKLTNKVAIVTGGAQGLGQAIALKLAEEGAVIVINDYHNMKLADGVAKKIRTLGRDCIVREADVADMGQVKDMFEKVVGEFGRIDILVNNAGIGSFTSFFEVTEEEWHRVVNVNLLGTYNCCRVALKSMVKQRYGKIVNTGSLAGKVGGILVGPHYSVAKAGIICLNKTVAKLAAPDNINVNCISPGLMDTQFHKDTSEEKKKEMTRNIPLGRMGTPEDVANLVLFLVSEESSYITGANIDINGGLFMD